MSRLVRGRGRQRKGSLETKRLRSAAHVVHLVLLLLVIWLLVASARPLGSGAAGNGAALEASNRALRIGLLHDQWSVATEPLGNGPNTLMSMTSRKCDRS